jgi:hypothetical protein
MTVSASSPRPSSRVTLLPADDLLAVGPAKKLNCISI